MHEYGVTCMQTKELLTDISKRLQRLVEQTPDTLFIVTADHGQIDVAGDINMYANAEMYDMLETPPYGEPRAIIFKVKPSRRGEFAKHFNEKYGEDFELHESGELIEKGFFGEVGDKALLLGDYIAIGTYTHKQALILPPDGATFKGHHTSLTEEMLVPLIMIGNK